MDVNTNNACLAIVNEILKKVNENNDNNTNNNSNIRKYTLNKRKALEKKRAACDIPFINVISKDAGDQLKIDCSAGC